VQRSEPVNCPEPKARAQRGRGAKRRRSLKKTFVASAKHNKYTKSGAYSERFIKSAIIPLLMTWQTIATDGHAVGNLEFLSNYWQYQRPNYKLLPAEIKGIKPGENHLWEQYDIKCEMGVATFHIRKSLRPTIHQALGIPQSEQLEGKVFHAYYQDRTLMGFTPLVNE